MTITIVKGIAAKAQLGLNAEGKSMASNTSQAGTAVATASAPVTTEAAVTSVRARQHESTEKIRDPKEAQKEADKVARDIRENDASPDAHYELNPTYAREHFSA